jgi:hypothetical protein
MPRILPVKTDQAEALMGINSEDDYGGMNRPHHLLQHLSLFLKLRFFLCLLCFFAAKDVVIRLAPHHQI